MAVQEKLTKNTPGPLELASVPSNVSEACRVMGNSQDTFNRVKRAHRPHPHQTA